jgi:hypothetical protein
VTGDQACAYEIRVAGHLDPRWTARLHGLRVEQRTDGTCTLTGTLADQAQLHGVLARVRDLGIPLVSVRVLIDGGHEAG